MSSPVSRIAVRPYRPEDRAQVRSICFETGLMGRPVAPIYSDRESFADMFSGYYTDVEPESAFVAVPADDEKRVVGYLLGCVDSRRAWDPAIVGAKHALLRGLLLRRGTAGFYFRLLADVIRDRGVHRPSVDLDRHPAHFHINLLPDARGGVGLRMHLAFLETLRARGVAGVHAEMIAENRRTHLIAQKLGYTDLGATFPIPGMRDLDGSRVRGRVVVLDLNDPNVRAMASQAGVSAGAAV